MAQDLLRNLLKQVERRKRAQQVLTDSRQERHLPGNACLQIDAYFRRRKLWYHIHYRDNSRACTRVPVSINTIEPNGLHGLFICSTRPHRTVPQLIRRYTALASMRQASEYIPVPISTE